jgi:uncharacterized protein DUF6247
MPDRVTDRAGLAMRIRARSSAPPAIVRPVTAAAEGPPQPRRPPFADATPAQIRDALGDHEAAEFAEQWRAAMDRARDRLDLSEVQEVLAAWRRIAWLVTELGPDGYRSMITSAEERIRTGERAPGSIPWEQLKVELGIAE